MSRLPIPPTLRGSLLSSTKAASTSFTPQNLLRPFSSTPSLPRKEVPHPHRLPQNRKPLPPPEVVTKPPPYPFGPRGLYKQSNTGLYGLSRLQYGNTIAEKYGNKSRRRWKPNVHRRRLFSEHLGRWIKTKVTSRVLRTIDKLGGIDNYLMGDKSRRIQELGPHGWNLRWMLMRKDRGGYKMNRQMTSLRVPAKFGEREMELREKIATKRARLALAAGEAGEAGAMGDFDYPEEDVHDDPALKAEMEHKLDNDYEFELGDPKELAAEEGKTANKS
ncbi:uncharacterized protein MKZ38_007969 [Zalerion maritima]|uniref:Large ribosomal subunit protein bL28m n=1 Tax=Zalerion maritima TaxID=339359 RepID=A0AAD5RI17_9PEZI|nr:uncharacterized protein MKZ38_007969 [Zalerion maritima]